MKILTVVLVVITVAIVLTCVVWLNVLEKKWMEVKKREADVEAERLKLDTIKASVDAAKATLNKKLEDLDTLEHSYEQRIDELKAEIKEKEKQKEDLLKSIEYAANLSSFTVEPADEQKKRTKKSAKK